MGLLLTAAGQSVAFRLPNACLGSRPETRLGRSEEKRDQKSGSQRKQPGQHKPESSGVVERQIDHSQARPSKNCAEQRVDPPDKTFSRSSARTAAINPRTPMPAITAAKH